MCVVRLQCRSVLYVLQCRCVLYVFSVSVLFLVVHFTVLMCVLFQVLVCTTHYSICVCICVCVVFSGATYYTYVPLIKEQDQEAHTDQHSRRNHTQL